MGMPRAEPSATPPALAAVDNTFPATFFAFPPFLWVAGRATTSRTEPGTTLAPLRGVFTMTETRSDLATLLDNLFVLLVSYIIL